MSKSISTTSASDNKLTNAGDVAAPQSAGSSAQNNASEGVVVRGGYQSPTSIKVDRSIQDSRNFGNQLGNIGAGANVTLTSSDPAVVAAALQSGENTAIASMASNLDATKAALMSNLGATTESLKTVQATNADAFRVQSETVAALAEIDRRRDIATSQAINAGLDMGRTAAASAEALSQNALNKLAEQRAPDSAAVVKIVLGLIVAAVVAFGLGAFRSKASAAR